MFHYKSTKFNSVYNTANVVIQKPGPNANGDAADCTDDTVENKGVRDRCFLNTDSCTYLIKGSCLAPGFHTKWDNTMDSSHVDIQVLEWDSQYTVADDSITTRFNTK